MGSVFRLLGIGWYVALCILGGGLGGYWLDGKLDISPLFTLLGLGLGLALAFFGMIKMLMAVLAESPDPSDEGKS